ncbi:MAG: TetR family transcriptional regulator [Burkholderiales bacterium]|nr:TetR family transcriptional regulator [Burkholderiales bacterium]
MATRLVHADSRLPRLLDEAARLFRSQGFGGSSMRDIARAVEMSPGSLYCHFATKEELLAAVYLKGVDAISAEVEAAVAGRSDPWERLERACIAHLEAILRDNDYAQVVVRVRPSDAPVVCERLIALRNRYEALFVALIAALPLPTGSDRHALRLLLIGALNGAQTWYRPDGRLGPRAIARRFVGLIRSGQEALA